ncbi:uncharacterized protein LOC114273911 isoform X2 [Camellia sinensis]|uniref:uncharacterized protein LOC114273911 isoform X2 n=1 Tax=Camellia sinensis TaxID=4442 RepID=UPI001035CC77|nr:uncharacterized protein LOC114273911 isoform X2 [Camellia sinensis]XP_028071538.1 uncharacterized protein LOC114273911 isoform X2 [Camellia sinensis]
MTDVHDDQNSATPYAHRVSLISDEIYEIQTMQHVYIIFKLSLRFDDAIAAAQRAAWLDSSSKEVNMVVRSTRAVAMALSNGNDLFRG